MLYCSGAGMLNPTQQQIPLRLFPSDTQHAYNTQPINLTPETDFCWSALPRRLAPHYYLLIYQIEVNKVQMSFVAR
jgi:hypothetical protein